MIALATNQHPELLFTVHDVHDLSFIDEPFDYIVLSDVVNDLYDVQTVFEQVSRLCRSGTRVILNFYSHVWALPLRTVRRLGLATPMLPQNWLTVDDVVGLLNLAGLESVRAWGRDPPPSRGPAGQWLSK